MLIVGTRAVAPFGQRPPDEVPFRMALRKLVLGLGLLPLAVKTNKKRHKSRAVSGLHGRPSTNTDKI